MTLTADSGIDYLAEIRLVTPLYVATQDELEDELGNLYEGALLWAPTITRTLSQAYYGVGGSGSVTLEIGAREASGEPAGEDQPSPPNVYAARFRAEEARGLTVLIRRRNRADSTITLCFRGTIQQIEYATSGAVCVVASDTLPEVFVTPYPRVRVTTERWPTLVGSDGFDHDATVPIHLGSHREHTPCRHAEETVRNYAHGTSNPRLESVHRYVVGGIVPPAVPSQVTALYRGTTIGAQLIPRGEYAVYVNRAVEQPPLVGVELTDGGDLMAGTYEHFVRAWNGVAGSTVVLQPTIITITATDVSEGRRSILVTWEPVEGAVGYHVGGAFVGQPAVLRSVVAGGDAGSFLDLGSDYGGFGTDGTPFALTTPNVSGQDTVEVVFRRRQDPGNTGGLTPILADVETTEMGWDGPTCRSVWRFDGDARDDRPGRQNPLQRASTVAHWIFRRDGLSQTGNNPLTLVDTRPDDFVIGPWGAPVLKLHGVVGAVPANYATLEAGDQTGLNFGSGSFSVECEIRTDEGPTDRVMSVFEKGGYVLRIDHGRVYGALFSATGQTKAVLGVTRLDGARHRLRLSVDRVAQLLSVYVDDELADSTDITGVAAEVGASRCAVGTSMFMPGLAELQFWGEIGWIRVDADAGPLLQLAEGKTGRARSAVDFGHADQAPLLVPHDAQIDLDIIMAAGWTLEAWIYPITVMTAGICGKWSAPSANGMRLEVRAVSGALSAQVTLRINAIVYDFHGGPLSLNHWHHVAVTYVAPSYGDTGTLRLYVNGVRHILATLSAGAIYVYNGNPFVIGARQVAPTRSAGQFAGRIDEVRVTARARTADEISEAYFLGTRNLVRQVRTLLTSTAHGPALTLDATSWDLAERDLAAVADGALVTDYALVEAAPLGTHVDELLKLRGVRLAMVADGTLGCTVDHTRTPLLSIGYRDGYWDSCQDRPSWSQASLPDLFRSVRVRYRRRRSASGEPDRLILQTSVRAVSAIGREEPERRDALALRDPVAADGYAGYLAARLARTDRVRFSVKDEACLALTDGDLVTFYDPITGVSPAGVVLEVRTITETVTDKAEPLVTLELATWDASIYANVPGDLPVVPEPDARPDYSGTPPPMIAGFNVQFQTPTTGTDGRRIWRAVATWTPPTSENIRYAVIQFRETTAIIPRPLGEFDAALGTAALDDQFLDRTSYTFRLMGRNIFGLLSAHSDVIVLTTVPGEPATPTGLVAAPGGHRSRRWKWAKNAERDLAGYDYEIYPANPPVAANRIKPQADDPIPVRVKHEHLTYTETNLQAAVARWARIRASKKGDPEIPSPWTALVSATGAAVATDDVEAKAVTQTYSRSSSEVTYAPSSSVRNAVTVTGIVIPANGESVKIVIDISIRYVEWGQGGDNSGLVQVLLVRGSKTLLPSKDLEQRYQAAIAAAAQAPVYPKDVVKTYQFTVMEHDDQNGMPASGTYSYALKLYYQLDTMSPPQLQKQIGMATQWWVTVHKR